MQLTTTFRGLGRAESTSATRNLERNLARVERLCDQPMQVRAVVEGGPPEFRVTLSMSCDREDFKAQSSGYDLATAITEACERLRSQLVRNRRRRETNRQKPATA